MKKSLIVSLILNIITIIMVVVACIIMFTGFKFMHGYELPLECSGIEFLKFFTVESNIFVGITSLLFGVEEVLIINNKRKNIDGKLYLLKYMSVSAVSLTFFVVFTYLWSISEHGLMPLLMNSNLFFHLIIPVISIINFVIFERTNILKYKHSFYGIIPTVLYGIYYLINILIHMENGMVSTKYDHYWFVQNGVATAVIVVPVIFLISYVISLLLWKLNHSKK